MARPDAHRRQDRQGKGAAVRHQGKTPAAGMARAAGKGGYVVNKISFGYPYRCVRCGKAWKVNWSSCPECGGSLVEENYVARLLMRIGLVRRRYAGRCTSPRGGFFVTGAA